METETPIPVLARFHPSLVRLLDAYRRKDESEGIIRSRSGVIRAAVEEYLRARA